MAFKEQMEHKVSMEPLAPRVYRDYKVNGVLTVFRVPRVYRDSKVYREQMV